jgi:hypothetical protein
VVLTLLQSWCDSQLFPRYKKGYPEGIKTLVGRCRLQLIESIRVCIDKLTRFPSQYELLTV